MAITSTDQLLAASNQLKSFGKVSMAAKAAGTFQSLWTAAGLPTAGANPASPAMVIPTSATTGALPFVNPVTGRLSYISKISSAQQTVGTLILYDRIAHSSGLNGTLTTAQAVNGAALTRHTTGEDVELFLEVYTATGATASNVTISYTNSAGVAGRTTPAVAMQVTPLVGQMLPIPLQSGDTGIRSVQSVTLSASTATAGNFGITLVKRIAEIPITVAGTGVVLDPFALGFPTIENNACLSFMVVTATTSTGFITGTINIAQG